jgi:hypothetical protein
MVVKRALTDNVRWRFMAAVQGHVCHATHITCMVELSANSSLPMYEKRFFVRFSNI